MTKANLLLLTLRELHPPLEKKITRAPSNTAAMKRDQGSGQSGRPPNNGERLAGNNGGGGELLSSARTKFQKHPSESSILPSPSSGILRGGHHPAVKLIPLSHLGSHRHAAIKQAVIIKPAGRTVPNPPPPAATTAVSPSAVPPPPPSGVTAVAAKILVNGRQLNEEGEEEEDAEEEEDERDKKKKASSLVASGQGGAEEEVGTEEEKRGLLSDSQTRRKKNGFQSQKNEVRTESNVAASSTY